MQHDVVTGNAVGQLQQFGGVVVIDQRHAVVEGVMAAAKGADEGEALDARQEAGGARRHLRHDDGYFVAHFGVDFLGQHLTEDEVEMSRFELAADFRVNLGEGLRHFAFLRRINALQDNALEVFAVANQSLPLHVRRVGDEFGDVGEIRRGVKFRRDDTGAVAAAQHGVRGHGEHFVAHLCHHAVHDGEDDDERGDADGDADDGEDGVQADEAGAAARVAVAQADFGRQDLHSLSREQRV